MGLFDERDAPKPLDTEAHKSKPKKPVSLKLTDKPLAVCPCCRTAAPKWKRKDGSGEPRCSLCHPPVVGLETEPA